MLQHRFQILSVLLIALQLLIPSGAPWLHLCVESGCCAAASAGDSAAHSESNTLLVSQSSNAACRHHSHCRHSCRTQEIVEESSHQESEEPQPHDCSNCPVCQTIAAPRTLAALLQLPAIAETVELIPVVNSADPMLGFGLPCQCRAPPIA